MCFKNALPELCSSNVKHLNIISQQIFTKCCSEFVFKTGKTFHIQPYNNSSMI